MGPAAEILRGFDDSSEKALDDLWGRLRHRFGTVDECQQAMRDFESRRQSDSEFLAEFEQVLRTLHREAWPDQTDEQRDPVLKRRFEEGVASAELRQYLRLHHRDLDSGSDLCGYNGREQFVDLQDETVILHRTDIPSCSLALLGVDLNKIQRLCGYHLIFKSCQNRCFASAKINYF